MVKNRHGFTLTELMVAIALLGVIASFGIPSYNKAREKAFEKEAVHNMRMIVEANKLYYARNGVYQHMANVYFINEFLNLNIVQGSGNDHVFYDCAAFGPTWDQISCSAKRMSGVTIVWHVFSVLTQNRLTQFECLTGGCPSCPAPLCTYPEEF